MLGLKIKLKVPMKAGDDEKVRRDRTEAPCERRPRRPALDASLQARGHVRRVVEVRFGHSDRANSFLTPGDALAGWYPPQRHFLSSARAGARGSARGTRGAASLGQFGCQEAQAGERRAEEGRGGRGAGGARAHACGRAGAERSSTGAQAQGQAWLRDCTGKGFGAVGGAFGDRMDPSATVGGTRGSNSIDYQDQRPVQGRAGQRCRPRRRGVVPAGRQACADGRHPQAAAPTLWQRTAPQVTPLHGLPAMPLGWLTRHVSRVRAVTESRCACRRKRPGYVALGDGGIPPLSIKRPKIAAGLPPQQIRAPGIPALSSKIELNLPASFKASCNAVHPTNPRSPLTPRAMSHRCPALPQASTGMGGIAPATSQHPPKPAMPKLAMPKLAMPKLKLSLGGLGNALLAGPKLPPIGALPLGQNRKAPGGRAPRRGPSGGAGVHPFSSVDPSPVRSRRAVRRRVFVDLDSDESFPSSSPSPSPRPRPAPIALRPGT